MAEDGHKVLLNVYDLCQGLARQLSTSFLGKAIEGICNEVAQFLMDANIPDYIIELPNEVMSSPMGALIMPMIQNLETTLKAGAVPQAQQFRPMPTTQPSSATKATVVTIKSGNPTAQDELILPAVKPPEAEVSKGVEGDLLGDARGKIQEEISQEFAPIMATGTLRASEAAVLAARKVKQKYGALNVAPQQS